MASHCLPILTVFPQHDLWGHILQIHNCSFNRAVKRKREREEDAELCKSFGNMMIRKDKDLTLDAAFKKLCLQDDGLSHPVNAQDIDVKTTSSGSEACLFDSHKLQDANDDQKTTQDVPKQLSAEVCDDVENGEVSASVVVQPSCSQLQPAPSSTQC